MSAVGPAIWRTISREFSVPSSFPRKLYSNSTALRQALQRPQRWSQSFIYDCGPRIAVTNFTTASTWAAQVPLQPGNVPVPPQDSASTRNFKPVSTFTAKAIFGPHSDKKEANSILRTLQGQRAAGTLDEGIPDCDETTLTQGLEWLRANYPLDEDAAIIARLEREDAQESQESQVLIDRAEKLGIYKRVDPSEQTPPMVQTGPGNPVIYTPQQDPERNRVLGTSLLDKMREANKAARKAEDEAKKAEQEAAEAEAVRIGKPIPTSQTQALVRKQKLVEHKAQWTEHVQSVFGSNKAGEKRWPTMTKFQRLWPSAVFTAAVVGLSVLFAQYYTPPPRKARIWPDIPPAAATVIVVIGMNVVVFLAWHVVPLQRFLFKYFLSVPGQPRAFTILGNTFSHQKFSHLGLNMVVMWIFGTRLHDDIGRGPFLATLMACGAFSSFFSLSCHVFTSSFQSGALGASGVISGLMAAWCVVNSDKFVNLIFLPKEWSQFFPTLGFLAIIIASDLFLFRKGSLAKPFHGTDYLSHLGGYVSGITAGMLIRKRMPPRDKRGKPVDEAAGKEIVRVP